MEFESRSTALGGQICCAMGVLLLAACRRWQALSHGRTRSSCISPNKVRTGGFKAESLGQPLLRVVAYLIAVVLPWWKLMMVLTISTTTSSNKVCVQSFNNYKSTRLLLLARGRSQEFDSRLFSLPWWLQALGVGELASMASKVLSFSYTCSGCFGRRSKPVVFAREVRLPWSSDTKICGTLSVALVCRLALLANWWPLLLDMMSGASSTSRRRPCSELAVALIVISIPSGFIPGIAFDGRSRSSISHSCGGGPDCFSVFFLGVFFVTVRVFSIICALYDVPNVTCTRCFEY